MLANDKDAPIMKTAADFVKVFEWPSSTLMVKRI